VKPLADKVADHPARLGIPQHAVNLGAELFPKFPLFRQSEKLRVRHGTPQEIGQARCQGEFVHAGLRGRIIGIRLDFGAEQEPR